MENLEVWLKDKDNLAFFGNALSSGIGLAFAIASKANDNETNPDNFKEIKKWWEVFWSGLLVMYLGWIIFSLSFSNSIAIFPWAIFHGVTTSALVMLWLIFNYEKSKLTNIRLQIIFCLVFILAASSSYLDFRINGEGQELLALLNAGNLITKIVAYLIPFLPFVLLSWSYHKKHMATALIFLSYAYLQLPVGLLGKSGLEVDFITLIASKVFLIGAMFHTLGVRDSESKLIKI